MGRTRPRRHGGRRAVLRGVRDQRLQVRQRRRGGAEVLRRVAAAHGPRAGRQEAVDHPHNQARGTFIEIDGIVQPAPVPRFSRTPAATLRAGVGPGVDAAAALAGWGFGDDELRQLLQAATLR